MINKINIKTLAFLRSGLTRLGAEEALFFAGQSFRGEQILSWINELSDLLSTDFDIKDKTLVWVGESDLFEFLLCLVAFKLNIGFKAYVSEKTEALTIGQLNLPELGIDDMEGKILLENETTSFINLDCIFDNLHEELYKQVLQQPKSVLSIFNPNGAFNVLNVIAAWHIGCKVQLHDSRLTAVKVLRKLERQSTNIAVFSAERLKNIATHPALVLTNLKNLKVLICESYFPLSKKVLSKLKSTTKAEISIWRVNAHNILPMCQVLQEQAIKAKIIEDEILSISSVAKVSVVPVFNEQTSSINKKASNQPQVIYTDAWAVFVETKVEEQLVKLTNNNVLAQEIHNEVISQGFKNEVIDNSLHVTEKLNHVALLSMLNALSRLGLFVDDRARHTLNDVLDLPPVASRHRGLLGRWLKILEKENLLYRQGEYWQLAIRPKEFSEEVMANYWNELKQDWHGVYGSSQTIDYSKVNAESMPALIKGDIEAVHLLFPKGSNSLASALYRERIAARYQQTSVRALLDILLQQRQGQEAPVKVMEVGAGTGSTTEALLPVLDSASQQIILGYHFTDVSPAFCDSFFAIHGGKQRPWLTRSLYDIDSSPRSQGFSQNSLDVVIAGEVFNATVNTSISLHWVKEILRPGGWFIMTEPTTEEYWVMTSQAFMLVQAEDERAKSDSTFLSLSQWQTSLNDAGFKIMADLPPQEHDLSRQGHRFFACQVKTDRIHLSIEDVYEKASKHTSNLIVEVLDELPKDKMGEIDRSQLQTWAQAMTIKDIS